MTDLIEQLQEDHSNFIKILDMLDAQVVSMQISGGTGPDVNLIATLLAYIESYPNLWHHPVENAIFRALMAKTDAYDEELLVVGKEHKLIDEQTAHLSAMFNNLQNGVCDDIDQLTEELESFITLQRNHLINEETNLFPAAMKLLSDDDWKVAESSIEYIRDPLFAEQDKNEFDEQLSGLMRGDFKSAKDSLYDALWEHANYIG